MRCLAASDLHGSHVVYEWLVRTADARDVDVIVLAGDLLGCPHGHDSVESAQRQDAARIVRILQQTTVPIYYIMGNDDLVDLDPGSAQFVSIHGRRAELPPLNLVGYQYSLPFMGGVFEKPETEIHADLRRLERLVDENTVLVTHNPAYGVLDIGVLDIHAGSTSIFDLVQTRGVRAHVHGHIHQCFGRVGRHFNVASGGARRAMLIDLDTLESTKEKAEST